MQSGCGLSFPRRLSKSSRALPRVAQELGGNDRSTPGRLRNRGRELRRPAPFVRQSAQSATTRSPRPQTPARLSSAHKIDILSFRLACVIWPRNLTGPFSSSRGGIGRRVRLRTVWGNPWRFESSREQFLITQPYAVILRNG